MNQIINTFVIECHIVFKASIIIIGFEKIKIKLQTLKIQF